MTHQVLRDLRGSLYDLENIVDDIDRYFQSSNSLHFLNEIKKIETIVANAKTDLEHISSKISNKLDEE